MSTMDTDGLAESSKRQRQISAAFAKYVWFAMCIPQVVMLFLFYPTYPAWLIFLAGLGCAMLAILLAEAARSIISRRRGSPPPHSWLESWKPPF